MWEGEKEHFLENSEESRELFTISKSVDVRINMYVRSIRRDLEYGWNPGIGRRHFFGAEIAEFGSELPINDWWKFSVGEGGSHAGDVGICRDKIRHAALKFVGRQLT